MSIFIAVSILLLFAILILVYRAANLNTKDVAVNTITVSSPRKALPAENITILHLSDLHLENISISPQDILSRIKGQRIDVIAITGDFLDRKRSIPRLEPYLQALHSCNPVLGMYAVFGNHDYVLRKKNFEELKAVLHKYGFVTLQNENVQLPWNGEVLNIIGIDDYSTKRSNLSKAYQDLQEGYRLILTHDPNIVLEMDDYHYDYMLSGHFHGGQICWPKPYHLVKMGKLVKMNMVKGLHEHNGRHFYISEGLGQTGLNIRVGSRPEITFHEITS
ncbi:metallophosphoesterase [Bacillus lacus]|uniref:Metallophosphoesterase n=1 Tax=Metabacillus lacus TaxID=1983721 RepID=A0A7X2J0N4_9BACI|nr:metallophosphoesterase [Metabacillus lacus]MRX73292.1 metallophosphoesterase [Metabacillus lacus]